MNREIIPKSRKTLILEHSDQLELKTTHADDRGFQV